MTNKNIIITRGTTFADYVYLTDAYGNALDLTGYTLKATVKDKPAGTLLATLTCTNEDKYGVASAGWVKLSLDYATTIPDNYYRGVWSLLISPDSTSVTTAAAGIAEIFHSATTWTEDKTMTQATAMTPLATQTLAISGTNASATISARVTVRLLSSVDCFIKFGATANTTTSTLLVANIPEYFEPGDATTCQAITTGASGNLYITPMI